MSLQFKLFRVPSHAESEEEVALNTFLRSVKALAVHRDFVDSGPYAYTLFTVEYLSPTQPQETSNRKKGKIDYREVLCAEDFALFARLRQWRKDTASQEGTAVYTVFTNEQLAQIAGNRPESKTALQEIAGIGEAKVKKYGQDVLELVVTVSKEQSKSSSSHNEAGR